MSTDTQLVLASASPRRKQLLADMGVNFTVHATQTDESRREAEAPEDFVVRLARDKAKQASADLGVDAGANNTAILAADTIVVQGEKVFGKPSDYDHAQRIWNALAANTHHVMTAVCLLVGDKPQVRLSTTQVEFGAITEAQMQRYWQSGEPQDKAGAYGIQGLASAWVKQINGSYSNVVGLPLRDVNQLLTDVHLNWL